MAGWIAPFMEDHTPLLVQMKSRDPQFDWNDYLTGTKKAGTYDDKDELFSPEYLFRSGYLYENMGKTQDAIAMYRMIKDKYPNSQRGLDIDKYLARLGVIQ